MSTSSRRILVADGHEPTRLEIAKWLTYQPAAARSAERGRSGLFGGAALQAVEPGYEVECVAQGQQAVDAARAAHMAGRPFSVALVGSHMPPGWDGLTTMRHLMREFPDVQVILCAAHDDVTWEGLTAAVGHSDAVLVLKKPLDALEVRQAVCLLHRKWHLNRDANLRLDELRRSQRQVQSIIDYAPSLICLRGLDGRFLLVNGGFCHQFGISREALFGRSPSQVLPPVLVEALAHRDADALQGGRTLEWEAELPLPGGERTLLITKFPLYGQDGAPYAVASVMTDLSRRKAEEESHRHRMTMTALWRMSGTLAHEFNNLLTAIVGHQDLAVRRLDTDHPIRRQLDEIGKAAHAASGLASRLLRFSRRSLSVIRPCDIAQIFREQREALTHIIGPAITMELPDLSVPIEVMGDAEQLGMVLQDLATVAREAMPKGGVWQITARKIQPVSKSADAAPVAGMWELSFRDHGPGLPAETLDHLFDPSSSTLGGLVGMGLGGTKAVITQLGGHIRVASYVGQGTEFHVQLPMAERALPAVASAPARPTPKERPTILVAEDEDAIRDLIVQTLQDEGYHVLVGADGQDALGVAWQHQGSIDLLITDAIMPRLSGAALADRLLSRHPRLRVVFMSGYTESQAIRHQVPEAQAHFLQKPFSMAELCQHAQEALRSRGSTGTWVKNAHGG